MSLHPLLRLAQSTPDPAIRSQAISRYSSISLLDDISACQSCSLRDPDSPPSPPTIPGDPSLPCYLTLISSTPDLTRSAEGILRAAISRHVGIAWERVARLSLAYCGSSGHPPGPEHSSTCSGLYLERALAVVKSQVVLILREGGRAHPEIPWAIPYSIGSGFERSGRIYFILHHPQTILSVPALRPAWELDLMFVGRIIHSAFVQQAKRIFRTDSTWPYLIDPLLADLDPDLAMDHRLSFASRVVAETACAQEAIDRVRQSDLFGMTISEKNSKAKAKGFQ